MRSGISVDKEVKKHFQTFLKSKKKWMKMIIENDSKIRVTHMSDGGTTFKGTFKQLVSNHDKKVPAYFIIRLKPGDYKPPMGLFLYAPKHGATKQKFIYSSTYETLKQSLGNENFFKTIQIESLNYDTFEFRPKFQKSKELRQSAFMTNEERMMRDYEKELPSLRNEGKIFMKKHTEVPVEKNLIDLINKFKRGKVQCIIVKIVKEKLTVENKIDKLDISKLHFLVKVGGEPRYFLVRHRSRNFLIHFSPEFAKTRLKMIYSTSRFSFCDTIKGAGLGISKIVETDNIKNLSSEFLEAAEDLSSSRKKSGKKSSSSKKTSKSKSSKTNGHKIVVKSRVVRRNPTSTRGTNKIDRNDKPKTKSKSKSKQIHSNSPSKRSKGAPKIVVKSRTVKGGAKKRARTVAKGPSKLVIKSRVIRKDGKENLKKIKKQRNRMNSGSKRPPPPVTKKPQGDEILKMIRQTNVEQQKLRELEEEENLVGRLQQEEQMLDDMDDQEAQEIMNGGGDSDDSLDLSDFGSSDEEGDEEK